MSLITVCHPIHRWAVGGTERQLATILRHLPADRFRHIVLTRNGGVMPPLPSNVRSIDLARPQTDPRFADALTEQLIAHRVDILHLRGLSMLLDGLVAAERAGDIAVVLGFHGFETAEDDLPALRKPALGRAALRCDARWAVSKSAARSIERSLRLPMGCFVAKPNGVDVHRFAPASDRAAIRARLGLTSDQQIILCVGNYKPVKGQDVLLDAAAMLPAGWTKKTIFVFIGRDDLNGELQRRAAALSQPNFVARFSTDCDDPLPWYQAADLFVLPSRWEGLSNALLEAMACELPVIAAQIGGNVDAIEHERNGLFVPPDDAGALVVAIKRLLTDPAKADSMGRAARVRVTECFDQQTAVARYASGYEALARKLRARRAAARSTLNFSHDPALADLETHP
ncbi:MAG: glycosyltransferase family 4 protein [Planctomycetia bacterium]|nr:MAG: glycosyltransferase family 4 protein [Planctomycetia bacterium]